MDLKFNSDEDMKIQINKENLYRFSQYGFAANAGIDLRAMDVHEWHANTQFKPVNKVKGLINKKMLTINGIILNFQLFFT